MNPKQLVAPLSDFDDLGKFEIESAGELQLTLTLPLRSGSRGVWHLNSEKLDELVEQGVASEEAGEPILLVHGDVQPPKSEVPVSACVGAVPIHGARLTVACSSLSEPLESSDGFHDYLDGVHGVLENGCGVHFMFDGDGQAVIWSDALG